MLIGIDASRANVKERTGTEWYAYYIIEEIKKIADPDDQFILYSKEKLEEPLSRLPRNFSSKILKWPPELLWTQIRLAWEMLWHKPDVLFVPAHTIPLIHPKKTVTTLHDIGFERFARLYAQKGIGFSNNYLNKILEIIIKIFTLGKYSNTELDYHRWSSRLALNKAERIITISKFSKSEIIDFYKINPEKISIVYNAFDPEYSKAKDKEIARNTLTKYQITDPFFLCIGRLEEKKNTAGLIEGFGKFKQGKASNYKLVLIGKPGLGSNRIQQTINRWGLGNDVIILGWVVNEDLPYIMSKTEIFIFPSFYEGFGMPILEAMAAGTPVITSNFGAMQEIAQDAAILINPYKPGEITDAITRIITDHQLRDKLVDKGYQRLYMFSWSKSAQKTLHIIKNL